LWGHIRKDVWPWIWCACSGKLDIYLKYRPPNNKRNCKRNPKN
jgi:hypothetical protein